MVRKMGKVSANCSEMELESQLDEESKYISIIIQHKKYSHIVIFGYITFGYFVNICFMVGFFINNIVLNEFRSDVYIIHVFYALLPVDERTRSGRIISTILQFLYTEILLLFVLCWDTLVLASMISLIGQLKALHVRCNHALDSLNEEVHLINIVNCHKHYLTIIK